MQIHLMSPCGENKAFKCCLYVYVVFLVCFKTNQVYIHKSTALLSILW